MDSLYKRSLALHRVIMALALIVMATAAWLAR
jgi:hypothetical protein